MTEREILRHCLAVIAYRCGKLIHDAPAEFAVYDTGGGKTPVHILSHINDLIGWTLSMCRDSGQYTPAKPGDWSFEVARFQQELTTLDNYFASDGPIKADFTRLLQGPIADALTHVGQIAILRRMSGSEVKGENYYVADIVAGRLGPDQAPPRRPFK